MKYIALLGLCFLFIPVHAQAPTIPLEGKILPVATSTDVISIDALIALSAAKYGVSEEALYDTIQCESLFNVAAVGDQNHAHGLSQINDLYWPQITVQQADNPAFAIAFMAQQFASGNANEWTCARQLGYAK